MKAGVSTAPCGVSQRPLRPRELASACSSSNRNGLLIESWQSMLRARLPDPVQVRLPARGRRPELVMQTDGQRVVLQKLAVDPPPIRERLGNFELLRLAGSERNLVAPRAVEVLHLVNEVRL